MDAKLVEALREANRHELVETLREARALLARPGNDFGWSSWKGPDDALRELDEKIAAVISGRLPERRDLAILFAPTGPIQEVSVGGGWESEFLAVSRRLDAAAAQVYK